MSDEDIIRRYLTSINNPEELIDVEAVEQATLAVKNAAGPLERLQARQRLAEVSAPKTEGLEREFIRVVRFWARSNGISTEAFRAEGVRPEVLRRAGLMPRVADHGVPRTRLRRRRLSDERQRAAMPRGRSFTIPEYARVVGATASSARVMIRRAVLDGMLVELGPDPDFEGQGRRPTLYQVRS